MNLALGIAALALSCLAVLLVLINLSADRSERAQALAWRETIRRDVDTLQRAVLRQDEALVALAKKHRIAKATLLAARDAHDAKLAEHEERFERIPDEEGIGRLVEQHNAMARDLTEVKQRLSTVTSGAALRTATGA